jgi:hypothetical protein
MKRASFLERFQYSYTYALLHDAVRSVQSRFRRHSKPSFVVAAPAQKLNGSKMIRIV